MERNCMALLRARWKKGRFLCVGLDSDKEKLPSVKWNPGQMAREWQLIFNKEIADATHDLVCSYKPNFAFYASEGLDGLWVLEQTILYIHERYSEIPVILDLKCGEVEHSSRHWAKTAFDWLKADAVTVNPYLGREGALEPFLERADKGVFVLCRTSNPGAKEIQDFARYTVTGSSSAKPAALRYEKECIYEMVASSVREWNINGNCGLVVGATYPKELAEIRSIAPDLPILIPGVGSQGGDLEAAVRAGKDGDNKGFIINASRSIIFASKNANFAEAARQVARTMHRVIRKTLKDEVKDGKRE